MNQKIVMITIIVLVAAVIGVGLWLSGAGQPGPLSGCINCQNTTLTLSVDIYHSDSSASTPGRSIIIQGNLTSSSSPVPGRTVNIYLENGERDINIKSVVTLTDGTFTTIYNELDSSHEYYAAFDGDEKMYLRSESSFVSSPPWT